MFARVHATMREALRGRVFPSAVLLVADEGEPVLHAGYGGAERVDTVFDVASLTKAVATSVAAMWLVDRGRLDIRAPASRYLPYLGPAGADRVRLWHLLSHASGLPAWRPYYRELSGRALIRAAAREPLEAPPGRRSVYSDLGFILLGAIIERASGRRLDRLLRDEIYQPIGLARTLFRPGRRSGLPIAPTGRCAWRRRSLLGEVHDENAAALGGVAGHAGLFSTAHDLHRICRVLVDAWAGAQSAPVSREVVRLFWRRPMPRSTWCLGWDTPSPRASSAGRYLRRAVGHLGYTGCSIWVDPARARWVILLTNRVALRREPNLLKPLRPRLHDRILEALA